MPNHVLTADFDAYDPVLQPFRDQLEGRSMIVTKTEPLPVECVVRGYLAGSGCKDYRATGAVCGIPLPPGLRESDRLDPSRSSPPPPRRRAATTRTSVRRGMRSHRSAPERARKPAR